MRQWEAEARIRDGFVNVEFSDGQRIVVKNDGVTGYDFVLEYLECMRKNYNGHLLAIDQILQRDLQDDYQSIRAVPNVYNAHLAVQSMNCISGRHDSDGNINMEFTKCPRRATCRFNGYNEKYRDKLFVGCNPIYECGLTATQGKVAQLLANTGLQEKEIAEILGNSPGTIRKHREQIFATLNVNSRAELIIRFKGKRLS